MVAYQSARYLDAYRPAGTKYDPNQPRHPGGSPHGGEFAQTGAGSGGGRATDAAAPGRFTGKPWPARDREEEVALEWGSWQDNLTSDQRFALGDYAYKSYQSINDAMRNPLQATGQTSMADQRTRGQIANALRRHPISQDIVTYRGMGGESVAGLLESGAIQVGTRFGDRAFVSTSLDRKLATEFADRHYDSGVLVEVRLRKGAHAGHIDRFQSMLDREENEVLVIHNSKFTVRSIKRRDTGGWHVVVDHDERPDPPQMWLGSQPATKADPDHEDKFVWHLVTEMADDEGKAGDHWRGQPRKPGGRPDGGEWAGSGQGFGLYTRPGQSGGDPG